MTKYAKSNMRHNHLEKLKLNDIRIIEGLDKILQRLEELQKGLGITTIREWAKRIENEAKSRCTNYSSELNIEVVEIGGNRFNIKVNAPKQAIPFVIDTIERTLNVMSITTREIFSIR